MVSLMDILSFLAVGCFLSVVGEVVVRFVGPEAPGWRTLYHRTIYAHPIIGGALIAFATSLPVPVGMGEGLAGRLIWFSTAGGLSAAIYKGVRVYIAAKTRGLKNGEPLS